MNKSKPDFTPSSDRLAAQKAFFESLEQLDDIIAVTKPSIQEKKTSESPETPIDDFPWDDIAMDIENALHQDDSDESDVKNSD
jgi:hypothetical protein